MGARPISSTAQDSLGHVGGTKFRLKSRLRVEMPSELGHPVVGTGVDPVTSRFSGRLPHEGVPIVDPLPPSHPVHL